MIKSLILNNRYLHWLYYSSGPLSLFFQFINKKISQKKSEDINVYFDEINNVISDLDIDIFPMFGTLLCYYRDGNVKNTDDYDYATFNLHDNKVRIMQHFLASGFTLTSLSYIKIGLIHKLVEISFKYKDVKVDVFELYKEGDKVIHRCPNFRKESPIVSFVKKGVSKVSFKSYFEVTYNDFSLSYDSRLKLNVPSEEYLSDIFTRHYGEDWNYPKKSNFINFRFYTFVNSESYMLTGEGHQLVDFVVRS